MFAHYMKADPEQSLNIVNMTRDEIKKVNGIMVGIWHNYHISDNKHNISNYKEMIKLAAIS